MVTEAEQVDAMEDRADGCGQPAAEGDRMPAGLANAQDRRARIRAAAEEVAKQTRQQAQAEQSKEASARQRRERAEAGESVIGRIPAGPHRLAEAQAHLGREIARQQAKLDRRAGIIAAGKKPMGAPPVPVEKHSSVIRARRAVEAGLAAETAQAATDAENGSVAGGRPCGRKLPKTVANITDPSSRLMPTRRGFLQGYNAQVAITSDQMIAAVQVSQSPNDMAAFTPMMNAAQAAARHLHNATGRDEHTIGVVLADAGYCSDANLAAPGPDRLIAISKNGDQLKTALSTPRAAHPLQEPPLSGPWNIACAPMRGCPYTNGEERPSNPGSATSRRSSTDSLDADATLPQANCTSQQRLNLMKIYRAAPTA